MTRRELLASAAPAAAVAAAGETRPNVLLIMSDQHRADVIGAWGNPLVRTPHLDALARGGTRFTNHWAQHPVCMPSRASIFTGRYPSVHGVRSNGVPLARTEITMAEVFRRSGYRTGGAGKFHFIPHFSHPLPTMETHLEPYYGFQEFHIGEDGRRGEQALWIQREHPRYAGKPDHEIPLELHNSYWASAHASRFIRDCAREQKPFFAFCSFVDPHHPYDPPSPYREMYKERDMPPPRRKPGEHQHNPPPYAERAEGFARLNAQVARLRTQYYGEVTLIDDSIGRLLDTLDETGQRSNTLIVFLSDHGDLLGDHDHWYKGPYDYRSCANTPLILNWPGNVAAGKVVDGIAQEIDVFPTIADLVGLPPTPGVQGRSQKGVLIGSASDTGYASALIEHGISGIADPGVPAPESADMYTLISGEWRLSYYPGKPYGELFNLREDPWEFDDCWANPKMDDVKRKLKDELLDRVLAAHDPLPRRVDRY